MTKSKKPLLTVTLGGWYQRTTLHLSEIYDLMALGKSKLNLSATKLEHYHHSLNLVSVTREVGYLEYIKAITKDGIEIRYYEDGLYILETQSENIKSAQVQLESYFETVFNPAISYIFSLGAPTPKVLADIKTVHPVVVSSHNPVFIKEIVSDNNVHKIYSQIVSGDISVYKTPEYIFISSKETSKYICDLIEMQIFFREFKDQLEKYLYIHRNIWEEISLIREKGAIKGSDVEAVRNKLDSYQKTVNLINSRIVQMGSYLNTRASISRRLEIEKQLLDVFQYKFETLADTHSYIKEIWKMTNDYLSTAIQVVVEVRNLTTNNSIQSLRVITTVGVISGILGYLSKDQFPTITLVGFWYFIVLVLATWLINKTISLIYKNMKYELKFSSISGKK